MIIENNSRSLPDSFAWDKKYRQGPMLHAKDNVITGDPEYYDTGGTNDLDMISRADSCDALFVLRTNNVRPLVRIRFR
jgi:hypothetical protein